MDSLKRFAIIGSGIGGELAQMDNSTLIGLRNIALQLTPPSVAEKQMKFITDISFS
jgi:hypothetical protein